MALPPERLERAPTVAGTSTATRGLAGVDSVYSNAGYGEDCAKRAGSWIGDVVSSCRDVVCYLSALLHNHHSDNYV